MNLLRLKSVFALCTLFLLFEYNEATSTASSITIDDDEYCRFSDAEEDFCASYCYKSVKPPLAYIAELKEQIKANAQEHIERDNEIKELRRRLLDLSDYRDHIKSLNQHIEELRKTNDILRESNQPQNQIPKTEEDTKQDKDNLKKEIELTRKSQIAMERNCKLDIENLKTELELKSIKELKEHKAKEESLNNEIKELSSQVSSYRKQLEESQKQLSDNNNLAEFHSQKIKQMNRNLTECKETIQLIPKQSCKALSSNVHRIAIPRLEPFSALCNGDISGGGWIVIQKRFDGSEDFYRNWHEYRNGFGKLDGEFFIGLENLHLITNSQRYELYIHMEYFGGVVKFASYNNFRIGNEKEKYMLQSVGDYSGTAGDYKWTPGVKFSTYDQDNDNWEELNCAKEYHGGWWYKYFVKTNLNGRYYESEVYWHDSMHWYAVNSLKAVQMLIRPKLI